MRVGQVPVNLPPPVLAVFLIEPCGLAIRYKDRLEGLVSAALNISALADFEDDSIDVESLPLWFHMVMQNDSRAGREVLHGRDRYFETRQGEDYWDIQEWISCFDPHLRRWKWWDLIQESGDILSLWIDTSSEPIVPLEELWWAIYVSGADKVDGPSMLSSENWTARRRDRAE